MRNPHLDIARGMAMFLVIFGHGVDMYMQAPGPVTDSLFFLRKLVFSFHMPLFFFISGMVYRPRDTFTVLRASLVLLFTAYIVHLVLWLPFSYYRHIGPYWGMLVRPLYKLTSFTTGVIWFLPALALTQLVYHAWGKAKGMLRPGLAVAVVLSFLWSQYRLSNEFQLGTLLPGLVLYAAGRRMARYGWALNRRTWHITVIGLFVLLIGAPLNVGCAFSLKGPCAAQVPGFVVGMVEGAYGNWLNFVLVAAAGIYVLMVAALLVACMPGSIRSFWIWVGNHSMDFLLINGFFCTFVQPYVPKILPATHFAYALGIVIAMTFVQIASYFLLRPFTGLVKTGASLAADYLLSWAVFNPMRHGTSLVPIVLGKDGPNRRRDRG